MKLDYGELVFTFFLKICLYIKAKNIRKTLFLKDCVKNWKTCSPWYNVVLTHLFVKLPRSGDSEMTFSTFQVKQLPVTTSLTNKQ